MQIPMRIQPTIDSTPTLRGAYHGGGRRPPANLQDSTTASAGNPVVLARGSLPVRLTAHGARGPVRWAVKARPGAGAVLRRPAAAPSLSASIGQEVMLSTDAVGDHIVSATCTMSHDHAQWHVCFASVELANGGLTVFQNFTNEASGASYRTDVSATLEFAARVNVRAGGLAGNLYLDRVRVGVIQNMDDPLGALGHALRGEYRQGRKRGTFTENGPTVAGPWVDASIKLPRYDATVSHKHTAMRVISFSDTPGLIVPPYVLPTSAVKARPCAARDIGAYTLAGAVGDNQFRAAIVAWTKHAPNTFTVVAELWWELRINAGLANPTVNRPTVTPRGGEGALQVYRDEHPHPRDAAAAGYEVYGPDATSGGGEDEPNYDQYVWTQLPDAVPTSGWARTTGTATTSGSTGVGLSTGRTAQPQSPTSTPTTGTIEKKTGQ